MLNNKIKTLLIVLCLQPVASIADYDHLRLLEKLTANQALFGQPTERVSNAMWVFDDKQSESGHTAIVYKTMASVSNIINSEQKASDAIDRCTLIANTALQPENKDEKRKIQNVITNAIMGSNATPDNVDRFILNNVAFSASVTYIETISLLICSVETPLNEQEAGTPAQ